jgi:hypothetical protein
MNSLMLVFTYAFLFNYNSYHTAEWRISVVQTSVERRDMKTHGNL